MGWKYDIAVHHFPYRRNGRESSWPAVCSLKRWRDRKKSPSSPDRMKVRSKTHQVRIEPDSTKDNVVVVVFLRKMTSKPITVMCSSGL